jgi:hypothetical protein
MIPAVQHLWLHDLVPSVQCKDLDGILGKRMRCNGSRAVSLLDGWVRTIPPADPLLVDVSGGQIMAPEFVSYLLGQVALPSWWRHT